MKKSLTFLVLSYYMLYKFIAHAYRPSPQVCKYGKQSHCPIKTLTPSKLDGSILIYPGGKTRCAFEDFVHSNGYHTNKTYYFQVFPNLKSNKLLVYFQGGGVCYDENTCNYPIQCSLDEIRFYVNPELALEIGGILNRSHSENPFHDYNIVNIPYCTGDFHVGQRVRTLNGDNEIIKKFSQPSCLKNITLHQNGYENALSALKWALANIPRPDQLVVSGDSAGSIGAQLYSSYIAETWRVKEKGIQYKVMPDSYIGVYPNETFLADMLNFFGACNEDMKFPPEVLQSCNNGTLTITKLVTSVLKQNPQSQWFYVHSTGDRVLRSFYQRLVEGLAGYPYAGDLLDPSAFFSYIQATVNSIQRVSNQVSSFFVEGDLHVFVKEEIFYTIESITSVSLLKYVKNWIKI